MHLLIAQLETAGWSFDFSEAFGGGEKIISAIGGDAAPHRVGEKLLCRPVISAIERNAALLIGREPQAAKPGRLRRAGGRRLLNDEQGDHPRYGDAAPEPQQPKQECGDEEPIAFVAPARAERG